MVVAPPPEPPLLVARGEGVDPLEIPRDEELVFAVEVDVGFLGSADVGTVTLSSGVTAYQPPLPPPGSTAPPGPQRHVGWIRSLAEGSYLGYTLHHELSARHLPQTAPSILFHDTQTGSEHRRRELRIGDYDGKRAAVSRSDRHCKGCTNVEHFVESAWLWGKPSHCKKCKRAEHRIWDPSETRPVPAGTVDLLSAVYLARSMIRENRETTSFPVIDKQKLWDLTVRRGETRTIEVPAGRFRCVLVQLQTTLPPGEPKDKDGFSGLFGIRGTIRIWMDAATGVPVMITGELPVPVVKSLELEVKLKSHRGAPPGFVRI